MKISKPTASSLLFAIGLGSLFLMSISEREQLNASMIDKLSTELSDLKAEVASLKTENKEALSTEPLLGEVKLFAGNFAPRGWAFCEGQMLSISENSALFSLLGTAYGGDGRTIFGLPDLRGRAPIGVGEGFGLPKIYWGQKTGTYSTLLRNPNSSEGTTPITIETGSSSLGMHYIIALQGTFPSRSY